MQNDFQEDYIKFGEQIIHGEPEQLAQSIIPIPENFNWVRDVFEPLIVKANTGHNLLELLGESQSKPDTLTRRTSSQWRLLGLT